MLWALFIPLGSGAQHPHENPSRYSREKHGNETKKAVFLTKLICASNHICVRTLGVTLEPCGPSCANNCNHGVVDKYRDELKKQRLDILMDNMAS